jgi:Fe-S-cluster-containing dehydrogenase component
MANPEGVQIACPYCVWSCIRDAMQLHQDKFVRCNLCSALVSAESAITAAVERAARRANLPKPQY